ncbi:hypothetical protein DYQ86_20630 [Acidobacteria bacterium AB60]|nr:hypothetical protein DYQ86_20630 [Acidobacteria bacterium AB60]
MQREDDAHGGSAAIMEPSTHRLQQTELDFYENYSWCLNLFPTISQISRYLQQELLKVTPGAEDWRAAEIQTNVYLLACAISNAVDDYIAGDQYDFSKITSALPFTKPGISLFQRAISLKAKARLVRVHRLRRWRGQWEAALIDLLKAFLSPGSAPDLELREGRLSDLLRTSPMPPELGIQRLRVPAAFRSQDLTSNDVLLLGNKLKASIPDPTRPLMIFGLRTAGSYFAPLLRASLETQGFRVLDGVTVRPKGGMTTPEIDCVRHCVRERGRAVVIDEPVYTGSTLSKAVDALQQCGTSKEDIFVLVPVHASGRHWRDQNPCALAGVEVITLEPEEWYKQRLLSDEQIRERMGEYFRNTGFEVTGVSIDKQAAAINEQLRKWSDEKFHNRVKRAFRVELRGSDGTPGFRYVLAKSVGWGWFSYHASLAAERLEEYVPRVFGLRDGMLYMEWCEHHDQPFDRATWIQAAGAYVASRVRRLRLDADPAPALLRENRHKGFGDVAGNLSRAYGLKATAVLKRPRLSARLADLACPCPSLVDGKMRPLEWLHGPSGPLKTDFEQHGLGGKTEINMTDPAYDLAEAVLHWELLPAEEADLLCRYIEQSGDTTVQQRLFLNKLAAGMRAMYVAHSNLEDQRLAHRAQEFNRDFIVAWNFLTQQTMRHCASMCCNPKSQGWHAPIISLDIDGVTDRFLFGFPSTTAAGIEAISMLKAHGFSVAFNTARSIPETKAYCESYGFAGGVAEYGAFAWDANTGREQILVDELSAHQLTVARRRLKAVPGIFLNDDYRYSIRAYTYERGRTIPVPRLLIQNLLSELRLDRLSYHQTYLDTAVVAKSSDKGKGLLALLQMTGQENVSTIAIGDSDADLPMFATASRAFAPGNITCRRQAQALGCQIAGSSYQLGLLEIVRKIVHPNGETCDLCGPGGLTSGDLFSELLRIADRNAFGLLARAAFDLSWVKNFRV